MKKQINLLIFIALCFSILTACQTKTPQNNIDASKAVSDWIDYRKNSIDFSSLNTSLNEKDLQDFPDLTIQDYSFEQTADYEYTICYTLTDSTNDEYCQHELLVFDQNGNIQDNYLYFEEWQRVYYYANNTEAMLDYFTSALETKSYARLLGVVHDLSCSFQEELAFTAIMDIQYEIIDFNDTEIVIEINCSDSQSELFLSGKHQYSLSFKKGQYGYYIKNISKLS